MPPATSFPLYVETAFGRLLIQGYRYQRTASRARIWDVLREAGWTATRIRFDSKTSAWIARAFVRTDVAA